ncbi:unnamed protein product, partial [Alopecurus aequalis]
MAEFALGLTKTAVAGAVSRVKSAIEEEGKLRVRVQDDLLFITGEFEMMQSFLSVANAERTHNQVVRTWVRQLRGLAFDVEDCVEFVVHLDKPSRWDWLRRLTSPLVCKARLPLPLDLAVAEIQRLKVRVEDISHRNTRYNLLSNDSATQAPEQLAATADTGATSAFHILNQVWEAAGRKRQDMGDLKRLICSDGNDLELEVISLWSGSTKISTGGADYRGITAAILREAYDDQEICNKFKNRAWVKLMHPFNPEEFIKSVLTQFYESSHQANIGVDFWKNMKALVAMEDEHMQQVSQQRYLVFLEDLSTAAEWRAIRMYLPHGLNGSRIVMATQQLGLALSCTGAPYQVSELSIGQSLCAFFNKVPGRRSDMGDFIWQLRRRGTISVWGLDDGEMSLVHKVYTSIMQKSTGFEGVEFERHNWVTVPDPFDLDAFYWRLFFNFHLVHLEADKIAAVGMDMDHSGLIQECCKFLRKEKCLVVINGLLSTDDWDMLKENLLSEAIKSSIVVITEEESVATYCADEKDGAFNILGLEADVVLGHSIKHCQYYEIGGKEEGQFFSMRRNKARDWIDRFGDPSAPVDASGLLAPGVESVWGGAGAEKSRLIRTVYYNQMLGPSDLEFTALSWVDVQHPFNLTDFCWSLYLDFYSDNPEAKQIAAVGMIKGQDPVAECRKFLCEQKCFVVINGLHSKDDWDSIKDAGLSEPTKSCIVVIASDKMVAMHCATDEFRVVDLMRGSEADERGVFGETDSLSGRVFSNRLGEAHAWMDKYDADIHHVENSYICGRLFFPVVISVWGIAGVGKSSLIKSIYYNAMFGLRYGRKRYAAYSWVHVPNPFDLKEFTWHLLLDFLSDFPEFKENATYNMLAGHDPFEMCRMILHQHKCFVVIDALRSTHDWDLIKNALLLSKPFKGCIIVNTYKQSVAAHCAEDEKNVINVKGLEADAALRFFRKIAWPGKQMSSEEVKVSKLTLEKCGGLPKVIAAVGQYFSSSAAVAAKDQYFRRAAGECCGSSELSTTLLNLINADFMGNLENDPRFDNLRTLFSWMQSYFDACSDSLKPCIFYLSVFPAGHKSIRPRRLVRRWIAEGYSRDKIGSTAEENGEKLFSELIKLSIIQWSVSKVCQVNGFFREYIISRPMEDNLVFALEGRCRPNSQRAGQHLTVSSSWDRDKIVYESIDFTRLRSLTVFGKWMSFFVSDNMRLLRVLDLEDTSGVTNDELKKISKLLRRLKFLSVRGCREITRLPDSLCDMRQLQTLDIRYTSIVTLFVNISKLQKLQYIRAGSTMPSNGEAEDTTVAAADPPEANGDCTVPTEEHNTSTSDEDDSTAPSLATAADDTSTPEANGDCTVPTEEHNTSTSDEDDSTAPSLATAADDTSTPEANGDGTVPSVPTAAAPPPDQVGDSPETWSSRACNTVSTWFSNVNKLRRCHHKIKNGGVEVAPCAARGIGKLTALHTLGVVNVRGAGGKVVLKELKKLTQLRKLRLSGINRKNWQDLCHAISGHGYLESLSLQLDDNNEQQDLCCLDEISMPPEALTSLKLYGGNVSVSPAWMKQLRNLRKGRLEDLELTISAQEDMDIIEELSCTGMYRRLCLKPIQDGKLCFKHGVRTRQLEARVLKIDCSTHKLAVGFGYCILESVEVLVVHCSTTDSSLKFFGPGLGELRRLKEVWLTGSYSEATKQHLEQKVAEHSENPVLKLDEEP